MCELTSWKRLLIECKPHEFESRVGRELPTFEQLWRRLDDLHGVDAQKVLWCDVVSIWLLRYSQASKVLPAASAASLELLTALFVYVIDYLPQATGPFLNALTALLHKLIDAASDDACRFRWIDQTMKMSTTSKTMYVVVDIVVRRDAASARYVLRSHPHFVDRCLSMMWSDALANACSRALVSIYKSLDIADPAWLLVWQPAVMRALVTTRSRKNAMAYLLPPLLKACPLVFAPFMRRCIAETGLSGEDVDLLIGVAKCGQDLAIVTEPFAPHAGDALIPLATMVAFMCHQSPHYRLGAVRLFVGSPKSSHPVPQYIFDTLTSHAILDAFFMDDTEVRNEFASVFKSFLIRVRDSAHRAQRAKEPAEYLALTQRFLLWLLDLLLRNLTPGSVYCQTSLALALFEALLSLGVDDAAHPHRPSSHAKRANSGVTFPYQVALYSPCAVALLMDLVTNKYDDIREKSVALLLMGPDAVLSQILQDNGTLRRSLLMLTDLKGRRSESGARVVQFFAQAHQQRGLPGVIDLCRLLAGHIEAHTTAAASAPDRCHGHLTALRLILAQLQPAFVHQHHSYFQGLVDTFVGATYTELWRLCKPILAASTGDLGQERLVMTYSWKLTKEATLLLLQMLSLGMAEVGPFLRVVEVVIDQLSSVHHRGAFSLVYPTFVRCCQICVASSDPQLSQRPRRWLEGNLCLIEHKSQYITRRSGGLPYLITGILTAARGTDLVDLAMTELCRIAAVPYRVNADEKMDIAQVNAFNSMKHIFIDAQLSDKSVHYVKDALNIALLNCNSPTWAIRNCAVMLFTALQNRLFGTKKLGEILPTVNAKLFFDKYRGVKQILRRELEEALEDKTNLESVFPILTILMRLEETDDADSDCLKSFEPLLSAFLGHRVWKIREVAARALAAITKPMQIAQASMDLVQQALSTTANRAHGSLLAVREMFERIKVKLPNYQIPQPTVDLLVGSAVSFMGRHWAVSKTFVNVLATVGQPVPSDALNVLSRFIVAHLAVDGPRHLLMKDAVGFTLSQHLQQGQRSACVDLVNLCIISESHEVQLAAIAFCQENLDKLLQAEAMSQVFLDLWVRLVASANCWSVVKAAALDLLLHILIQSHMQLQPSELGSLIELMTPFTEPDTYSEDVNAHALEALGVLNAQYMRHAGVDHFFELAAQYADDNRPVIHRHAATTAVAAFIDTTLRAVKTRAAFALYFALWDDDRDVRDLASTALSRMFRFEHVQGSTAAAKHFTGHCHCELDPLLAESIVVAAICAGDLAGTLQLVQDKSCNLNALFDVESVNLYRNDKDLHTQLCSIAGNLQILPESKSRIHEATRQDLQIINDLAANSLDAAGVLNDELVYTKLHNLRLDLKLLQSSGLDMQSELESLDRLLASDEVLPFL